jgi:sorbitol/mannitol transport system substrate-binding protein
MTSKKNDWQRFGSLLFGTVAMTAVSCVVSRGAKAETTTLTVAMAANPQMETAETLISAFYAKYPDIRVKFQTLPENELRPAVLKDVATDAGQFDVVMIGSYEVPLWAQKGWIYDLSRKYIPADPGYDVGDLTTPIADIVSYKGDLYGLPFYGSSSFTYYRKDLFAKAGLTMPEHPTWDQIESLAAKLNDPAHGISGICLRGVPGWGQNLAALTTVINTFGGSWFDMNWKPQLTSPNTKAAVSFYVDLLRKYGEPDAAGDGWQECLELFSQGKAAMWYDDTVFAGPLLDQAAASVKNNVGFAFAPVKMTKYSGWLWAWGLSIPKTSRHADAAWKFISWVTSKDYIKLAGEKAGWGTVPPGSRNSTYQIPQYQQATAAYAGITQASVNHADPLHPTVMPVPYTGVQYVSIPEFEQIGDFVSQQVAGAIAGSLTVDQAMQTSQTRVEGIMSDAGYGQ